MFSKAVKILIGAGLLLFISLNTNSVYEKALFNYVGPSVVRLSSESGSGTGFQITAPSGKQFILTNAHVCGEEQVLLATDFDGKAQKVAVLDIYQRHDLCLVQGIPEMPSLSLGKKIKKQQDIYTIGNPSALNTVLEQGRYLGITNIQVGYKCTEDQRKECLKEKLDPNLDVYKCFLRMIYNICPKNYEVDYTNNSIAPGSSGSPAVDAYGRVVGVVFAGSTRYNKAAFLVPLEEIRKFLKDK